jgi:hypothetical protein
MRVFALGFVAVTLALASLAALSCESSSSPTGSGDAGSALPSADGAVCACATPDCLPNCADLVPCAIVCVDGSIRDWVDPCGNVDYAETCPNGCADAATACQ